MNRIEGKQIDELNSWLDEGLIDDSEYKAKINSLLKFDEKEKTKSTTNTSGIIVLGVCLFTLLLLIAIGASSDIEVNDYSYEDNANWAVEEFYLDSAVIVIDNGDGCYHRYNCPKYLKDIGDDEYVYWVYNVEAAKGKGYSECTTCFSINKDEYIENYLGGE